MAQTKKALHEKKLLSVQDAANYLGVDRSTVIHFIATGVLPAIETPRGWKKIPIGALERFAAGLTSASEDQSHRTQVGAA